MSHFGLLTLFTVVLCALNQAASEVYYIATNSTDLYTEQLCLTLSQFVANLSHYLHSNTTLVFLPGIHYLNSVNPTLSNVDKFVMKSENSTAQIQCTSGSSMHFNQSQYVHISNLEFIGCGGNRVEEVELCVIQYNSGTALELIETTAQIVDSTFVTNRKGSYRIIISFPNHCQWYESSYAYAFLGGAIIATNSTVDISQGKFEDNRADLGGVLISIHSNITIEISEFHNNSATYQGGVLYSYYSTITIETSKFHSNSATFQGGVLSSLFSTITIETSKFHSNSAYQGGVLYSKSSVTLLKMFHQLVEQLFMPLTTLKYNIITTIF